MFSVGNAESATLFPQEKLFGSGEQGIPKIQFQRAPVGVAVRNGVDDGVAWDLICPILYHVAQHQRLVVAQVSLVEVGLDGACDFLKRVFALCTLYFLK